MQSNMRTPRPRRPSDFALIAIVIIAFYRVPSHLWFSMIFTVGSYKMSLTELILVSSFILIIIQKLKSPPYTIILFGTVLIFSVIFSTDPSGYFPLLMIGLTPLLLTVLLASTRVNTDNVLSLLKTLFVSGAIFLIVAVITRSLFGPDSTIQSAGGIIVMDEMVISLGGEDRLRLSMPGLDKNKFAMQMVLAGIIGLFFWRKENRQQMKFTYLALSLILLSAPLWAFSKGSFISALVSLTYLLTIARWFKLSLVLSLSFVAALVSLLYSPLVLLYLAWIGQILKYIPGIDFVAADLALFYDVWDTSDRFVTAPHALELFISRPLLGVGYGSLERIQPYIFGSSEHNYYIRLLAETGVLGLGVLLYLIANQLFWLRKVGRRLSRHGPWNKGGKKPENLLLIAQLLTAMYLGLAVNLLVSPADYNFWIVTGLIIAWRRYGTVATATSAPGGHGVRYNQQSGARPSARAYQTGRRKHYR